MDKIKTLAVILVLFLISLPIYRPIFDPGLYPVHDDLQIQRIVEMAKALRDGQFPVRMVSDLGYGYHYALYNFYAPLPYYVGAVFNLIGFDYVMSTKLMIFLPNFLSLVFMFLLMKKITRDNMIAMVGATLYAYFPYRAVDNYVRGVSGEIYVMMFLPVLIYGLIDIFQRKEGWWFTVALSGILLSHNIYAFLVCFYLTIFFLLYVAHAFLFKNKNALRVILHTATMSVLTLGLTAFFWLPAIAEGEFTHLDKLKTAGYYFGNYFIPLSKLWQSEWSFGGATDMSFMVGKVYIILGLIAFLMLVVKVMQKKKENMNLPFILLFFVLISVFFTNHVSFYFWDKIPFLSYAQYPLRFIFFIDFFLILFFVYAVNSVKNKLSTATMFALTVFICAITIYRNQGYFISKFNYKFEPEFISQQYMRWDSSVRSDEYLPKQFILPIKKDEIADGSIKTNTLVKTRILKNTSHEFVVSINNPGRASRVTFPVTFFPGWKMYVNNKETAIQPMTKFYLISGAFGKGDYLVLLKFEDTPVRTAGNIITLLSFALCATLIYTEHKKYGPR